MKVIINFLVNNYVWFLTISLILAFGLIGYLVDVKGHDFSGNEECVDEDTTKAEENSENENEEESIN